MSATLRKIEAPVFGANVSSYDRDTASPDTASSDSQGAVEEREQLLTLMRGARVRIPDMQCLMSHWPQGVNPEIERLDEDVMKTLES